MKNKLFSLILMMLFAGSVFSQGALNKKVSVYYTPSYSLWNVYAFNSVVLYQGIGAELHLNRRWGFNVHYESCQSSKAYRSNNYINDKIYGFQVIRYRKLSGGIAPNGRYLSLGLNFGTKNAEYLVDNPDIDYGSDDSTMVLGGDLQTKLLELNISLGRNFLFKNGLIFGFGMQSNYNLIKNGIKLFDEKDGELRLFRPYFKLGYSF